jgi:peptide/nickel transport system substrate-binding protein
MVLDKNPDWPGIRPENPDHLVFVRIQEDEARVTALLNGEVQIATAIPPHLAQRVEAAPGVKAIGVPSVEVMFLAMNPHFPPWNNIKLREAVAYAIDREAIIRSVFQGRAEALHGPIGPGQYAYSPDIKPKYRYDPEKAKALVKEAGFPNGVDVNLFASADRYVNDRQSSEAIAAMLTQVGIRTRLHILDYSIEWPNVRKGVVPFYYQGRGSVIDPSPMLEQYFQSGVTPRIGFSDPKLDEILRAERSEFDPAQRKALLLQAFDRVQDDVPAVFLWRIDALYGISNKVKFKPHSDERIFGTDILVK